MHFYRFSMAGSSGSNFVFDWVFCFPSGITRINFMNSFYTFKNSFNAPKAACGKISFG
jgi:hypothetical protein